MADGGLIPGTLPETWDAWVQLINSMTTQAVTLTQEQQIATREAFQVWCQQHNIVPITTVREVVTGFGEVVNSSPTTGTDVIVRPVTTLVPVAGGTAAAEIVKDGGVGIGLVKKGIAVTAALSLLAASIGAFQVSDENKERLEAVADDYTVDGENVPVLIDRSGNTFLQNDLLEAMRAEMVRMGVFSSGDPEIVEPPGTETTLKYYRYEYAGSSSSELTITRTQYIGSMPAVKIMKCSNVMAVVDGQVRTGYALKKRSNDVDITPEYCVLVAKADGRVMLYPLYPESETPIPLGSRTECKTYFGGVYYNWASWYVYSYSLEKGKTEGQRAFKIMSYDEVPGGSEACTLNGITPTSYNPGIGTAAVMTLYSQEGGAGVEGITPAADLIQNGVTDLTKTLREVVPDLGPSIKTATPTDADLYDQTDWDPISLLGVNPWTDGLTEAQHESATDGKPDEKSQEDMLEAIKQLIADYFPDPTYPVPDPEPTPEPAPPMLDGSSNGLWAIYNPTKQQVKDFGAWLWSDSIIDQIERQFKNSPIDAVIGFHQIYCTPITGAAKTIKAGYLDSPVSAPEVTNQYADIDCGTVSVTEYYRNAIDYMLTKISLYLPFIGFVPLDAGIVMGSQVNISYRIDVLTGACIAQVRVMKSGNTVVFYNYQGNCAVQIPLTASTYTGIVGALMGAVTAGVSVMTGNAAGAFAGVRGAVSSLAQGHQIQQSGSLGSNAGALGIRIPYMIIARPIQHMPAGFESLEGIPSNDTVRVGDCTGFLRVKSAHYDSITDATADEVNMIRELLEGGIMV